jgi:hypothetical protein
MESRGHFTWYSSEKLEMENGKQRTLHLAEFRKTDCYMKL